MQKIEAANHKVVLGCTGNGMHADPYLAFAVELHQLLEKHTVMMAQGRAGGVQIAVTPRLAEMLSMQEGSDAYIHNLRRLDDEARANGNAVFESLSHALVEAGYIPGQTYEQCLAMAAWHPGMRGFMSGCGPDGSEVQERQFSFARRHLLG